jgi:hypothetical protein
MAAGDTMQGTRVEDNSAWYDIEVTPPGSYGRTKMDDEWVWRCRTPNGMGGLLSEHDVIEHDDGTITVSPSILVNRAHRTEPKTWHGYLERGVWREV